MSTTWIYQLKKPELVQEAEERDIQTEGLTVEQIRKLLVEAVKETDEGKPDEFKTPDKKQTGKMDQPDKKEGSKNLGKIIRDWNLTFKPDEAKRDAVEFVERLEELISASSITKEDILPALPRILQGKALLWYRNNVDSWKTWEEFLALFKLYYYPANYEENLVAEIVARKQRYKEKFTDYLTDLQTLMRRYGNLSGKEKLHRIHENMQKNYKLYIRKQDFKDLSELLQLASEYEDITTAPYCNQYKAYSNPLSTDEDTTEPGHETKINPRYDARTCCWACGKPGHSTKDCRSQRRIFCSVCGKQGVLSKNCCKTKQWGKNEAVGAAGDLNREDNRMYEQVQIMGKVYHCLVDTGSTNTYIDEQTYKECIENGAVENEVQREVTLANGARAQVKKNVLVDIKMKNAGFKHWVRVLPSANCTIVGMDVLKRVGMTVTWTGDHSTKEEDTDDEHRSAQRGPSGEDASEPRRNTIDNEEEIVPAPAQTHINDMAFEASETEEKEFEALLQREYEQGEKAPKGSTPVERGSKLKHTEPIKQSYYPRNPEQKQYKPGIRYINEKQNHITAELSRYTICTAGENNRSNKKLTQTEYNTYRSKHYCVKNGKLYRKIAQRLYWPGMQSQIVDYIKKGEVGQRHKAVQQKTQGIRAKRAPDKGPRKGDGGRAGVGTAARVKWPQAAENQRPK